MSDIELNNEERLALEEVLSMKSQDSEGNFFGSRDEIQNILESRYSGEIDPERINDICNEVLSPMFDGGVTPKYENVKSYMENYQVFMEDASPVKLNTPSNEVSKKSPNNNEKQGPSKEGSQPSQKVDSDSHDNSSSSDPANTMAATNDKEAGNNSDEKLKSDQDYEREKDRRNDLDQRTRESYEKSQELKQRAAQIRRDMATKSFMNPYSLMGYTFARLGTSFERIAGNFLASRAFAYPFNFVRRMLGKEEKTFSGKKILGIQASYNAKDPRSFQWEKGETNKLGNKALEISKNIPLYIRDGNFPLVNERMHTLYGILSDNKDKADLNLKSKKQLQENLKKISEMLTSKNEGDSPQDKEAKKKLAKMNKEVIKMIARMFGVKMKDNGPEISGP